MTNLQKIVEEIFTPEELALIDSGEYKPGRAVLDAKIDLVIAVVREECAKLCDGIRYSGYCPPEDGEARHYYNDAAEECADAIRTMGET